MTTFDSIDLSNLPLEPLEGYWLVGRTYVDGDIGAAYVARAFCALNPALNGCVESVLVTWKHKEGRGCDVNASPPDGGVLVFEVFVRTHYDFPAMGGGVTPGSITLQTEITLPLNQPTSGSVYENNVEVECALHIVEELEHSVPYPKVTSGRGPYYPVEVRQLLPQHCPWKHG